MPRPGAGTQQGAVGEDFLGQTDSAKPVADTNGPIFISSLPARTLILFRVSRWQVKTFTSSDTLTSLSVQVTQLRQGNECKLRVLGKT